MLLSASISTAISGLHKGLPRRSLFTLQMHAVQRWCWLCQRPQGGNPHQWGYPHDQKNLPRDFHQVCQTPGHCRSLWSGLAGECAGYATCSPSQPPAWQQGAGTSPLPQFSVWLTLLLRLNFGDTHLIPAAPRGRYALWSCSSLLERATSVRSSSLETHCTLVPQTFTLQEPW